MNLFGNVCLGMNCPGMFFSGIESSRNDFLWDCDCGNETDGNETAGMMCPDTAQDALTVNT